LPIKKNKNPAISQILYFENHVEEILKIQYKDRTKLDDIAKLIDLNFQAFLEKQKPHLSSNQPLELQKRGFGISAHSWYRPLLPRITNE